jgi:hypothetical protein
MDETSPLYICKKPHPTQSQKINDPKCVVGRDEGGGNKHNQSPIKVKRN